MKLTKVYIAWIVIWLAVWIPLRYWSPLALRIRHTFQLPSNVCTNTLVSDLNSFEAVREGLFVLFILIPFSACFMLWSKEKRPHLLVSFLGLIWSVIMFCYDINDMAYANIPPNDPNFRPENLARDNRWCLYWGGQPGTSLICANNGPCSGSPVDPNTFMVNGPFVFRFVLNLFILLLIAINLWLMRQPDEEQKVKVEEVKKPIRYNISHNK